MYNGVTERGTSGGTELIPLSRSEARTEWKSIFIYQHDDFPEPREVWVRFFSDEIAVVNVAGKIALTVDRGETWNVNDLGKRLPDNEFFDINCVSRIRLGENGKIQVTVQGYFDGDLLGFESADFGLTWEHVEKSSS